MSSAFIENGMNSSTTIVIALVVLILAVGLMVFLFARSSLQRRGHETLVRERMLEMEREAQFAAAAGRVEISRDASEVALDITHLLKEYVSVDVIGIYVGHALDAELSNIFRTPDPMASGLPASLPSSVLTSYARPSIVKFNSIMAGEALATNAAGEPSSPTPMVEPASFAFTDEPVTSSDLNELSSASSVRESYDRPGIDTAFSGGLGSDETIHVRPAVEQRTPAAARDEVLLLPWKGPFQWNGVIIASKPVGFTALTLEPYRESLARLTNRLGIALELEQNDLATESSNQQAVRTAEFSRALISCVEQSSPLEAVVREVTRLVKSDSAAIWRVDESSGMVRMVAAHGLKSPEFLPLPVGQGLAGSVAQTGVALAIEDAPADSRCIFPREARESGILSYLGAALIADGKTLGVLEAHCSNPREWTVSDRRALESAATIVGELIKSTDSRGNRLRVESAYLGLSESLQKLRSAEELKEAVVEVIGHALGASRVLVAELDEAKQSQPVVHEYRQPSVKAARGKVFSKLLADGVAAGEAGGQPIAISDSRERSLAGPDTASELGILSEIAAPVRVDESTRAIVYVHQCDRVREWEPDEIEFAERVVRQLSLSLSNLRQLGKASNDARQAREESRRASEVNSQAPARIQELEQKIGAIERALAQSKSAEEQARGMLAKASALEAKARAEADVSRRVEDEVRRQLQRVQDEHKQAQGSAQQLLEINRLKSEFIVNAGHEIEASLQSVLGLAELLERGSYGNLTADQREAVHGIYGWARRIKRDVDWLIEYGATRSRRLESSGGN